MDQSYNEQQHDDFMTNFFSLRGPRATPDFEFAIQMALFLRGVDCTLDDLLFSLDLGNGVIPSVIVKTENPISLIHAFSNGYLFVTGEETLDDLAIVDFGSFHDLHFVPPSFVEGVDAAHSEDGHETELDESDSVTCLQNEEENKPDSLDHDQHSVPLMSPAVMAHDFPELEGSASHESPSSPDEVSDVSRRDSVSSYSLDLSHSSSFSFDHVSSLFDSSDLSSTSFDSTTSKSSSASYSHVEFGASMSGVFSGGSSELGLSQLCNLGSPMRVDRFHIDPSMDVDDMVSEVSREAKGANSIFHTSSSSEPGVKGSNRNVGLSGATASVNADRSNLSAVSFPCQDRPQLITQSQYSLALPSPRRRTSLRTASGPPASSDSIILPVVSLHTSEDSRILFDMAIRLL